MSIQPTSSVGAMGAYNNIGALTTEGLLMYCQKQLGDVDTQINEYFAAQKSAVAKKQILNDLKSTMSKFQPPKKEDRSEITVALLTAHQKLTEMGAHAEADAVMKELHTLFPNFDAVAAKFAGDPDPTKAIEALGDLLLKGTHKFPSTKESWSGHVLTIENIVQDVSSNAELQMIQLQSLASARQTIVQLTTNMMAKADQSLGTVIANIK